MAQPGVKLTNGTLDVQVLNSSLAGTESGLVVRAIPSGTQTISGTVGQGTAAALSGAWPYKLTDGTNTASVTAGGSLNVNITGGAASGSTTIDKTAFTAGSSSDSIIGGLYQATTTANPLADGQGGAVQLTINRAMHVNLRDSAGVALTSTSSALDINIKTGSIANTSFIATQSTPGGHGNYFWNRLTDGTNDVVVSGTGAIKVDGSGVTQPISGTVTANIGTTNGLALDATLTGGAGRFKLTDGTNNAALTLESTYGLNVHVNNATPIAVSMSTAAATTTTGSLTAVASVVTATVLNYDTALVTLKGTFAGVTAQFWLSDDSGTTFYSTQAVRTDTNIAGNTFALGSNSSTSYYVNVSGATNLQVKASAYTSGSVSVRISPNGSSFSPIVVAALTDNSGNIGTITAGGSLNTNVTNTVAVTGTVAISTGSATIGSVGLNAGSNLVGGVNLVDSAGTNKASISAAGAIKVDGSAVTQPVSGTVAFSNSTIAVTQATASALNATVVGVGTAGTASGGILTVQGATGMTAVKVDGSGVTQPVSGTIAVTGVATATNQTNGTQLTQISNGTNQAAVKNSAPISTDYALVTRNIDSAASYSHYSANQAVTNIKATAGLLKSVVVNSSGDTGATLTIYDTATTTTATTVAVINLAVTPVTLTYGLALAAGMAIVISGVTSSCDVTLLYA